MTKQPSNTVENLEVLLPISSVEIETAQRKALVVGGSALAVIVASIICANVLAAWASSLTFLALLASIYLFMFWVTEGVDAFKLAKPLSGRACRRLLRLVDSHPEIAGLVAHVRESGRQVSWGDLWRANSWLYEQALAEQDRARRCLNGVSS